MTGTPKSQGLRLRAASMAVLWLLGSALLRRQTTQEFETVQRSAREGTAASQYALGSMYSQGRRVTQDYAEAVRWYRKAADHGDVRRCR